MTGSVRFPASASPSRSGISFTYRMSATRIAIGMRRRDGLDGDRAAGLDDVGSEQHQRAEPDRGRQLTQATVDELQRRRRVPDRQHDAEHADDEERRRAGCIDQQDRARTRSRPTYRTSEMSAMPRSDTRPYWMTREPPLNWVGWMFASSAPSLASNMSLATFRAEMDRAAPMIVRSRSGGRTSPAPPRSRCRRRPG